MFYPHPKNPKENIWYEFIESLPLPEYRESRRPAERGICTDLNGVRALASLFMAFCGANDNFMENPVTGFIAEGDNIATYRSGLDVESIVSDGYGV